MSVAEPWAVVCPYFVQVFPDEVQAKAHAAQRHPRCGGAHVAVPATSGMATGPRHRACPNEPGNRCPGHPMPKAEPPAKWWA